MAAIESFPGGRKYRIEDKNDIVVSTTTSLQGVVARKAEVV
jgi:hypothetical protein